uniref:ORF8 n=1 Tax=Malaco herpesvirus 4 TaxID=3031800 RepID=A0AA48P7U5_9VIRU|nr:TPA_asm: ORF8 [Malaco herpesvirus 4]
MCELFQLTQQFLHVNVPVLNRRINVHEQPSWRLIEENFVGVNIPCKYCFMPCIRVKNGEFLCSVDAQIESQDFTFRFVIDGVRQFFECFTFKRHGFKQYVLDECVTSVVVYHCSGTGFHTQSK